MFVARAAAKVESQMPGLKFEVQRTRAVSQHVRLAQASSAVVQLAIDAFKKLNIESKARFYSWAERMEHVQRERVAHTEPDVGQHNIHSVLEFASLTEMTTAVAQAWSWCSFVQCTFLMVVSVKQVNRGGASQATAASVHRHHG